MWESFEIYVDSESIIANLFNYFIYVSLQGSCIQWNFFPLKHGQENDKQRHQTVYTYERSGRIIEAKDLTFQWFLVAAINSCYSEKKMKI